MPTSGLQMSAIPTSNAMLPTIVKRRVDHAQATAAGLCDAAGACTSQQEALRARLLSGAHAIDELVALLESATWVAKLNHDTILNRETA